MAKAGQCSTLSPVARVKQWIGDFGSPSQSLCRSLSARCERKYNLEDASGYKSAPDHLMVGPDFKHLKKLRDACSNSFGEDFNIGSSSNKDSYSTLYGANDELNSEDFNVSIDLEHPETFDNRLQQMDSCLFDNINSPYSNGTLFPVPWRSYVDFSDNVSTGTVETSIRLTGSTESVQIESPMTKIKLNNEKSHRYNHKSSGRFDKISLKSNASSNKIDEPKGTSSSSKDNGERSMRIKTGLQYFKSKRQLRILLLTVQLLKSKHCKLFVKLTLLNTTSKQKVVSRKVRCSTSTVELNEVLYIDIEDGKINGKVLKMRLCKETIIFKRVKTIGTVNLALEDLDISSDSCVWLGLRKCETGNMVTSSSFELVSDSECSREEPRTVLLARKNLNDGDLQLLLDCSKTQLQIPGNSDGRSLQCLDTLPRVVISDESDSKEVVKNTLEILQ